MLPPQFLFFVRENSSGAWFPLLQQAFVPPFLYSPLRAETPVLRGRRTFHLPLFSPPHAGDSGCFPPQIDRLDLRLGSSPPLWVYLPEDPVHEILNAAVGFVVLFWSLVKV